MLSSMCQTTVCNVACSITVYVKQHVSSYCVHCSMCNITVFVKQHVSSYCVQCSMCNITVYVKQHV